MHRSGTSLLAQVLDRAGIFMGEIKDHNFEAMHFLSLNQQTLWAAETDWINPKVPDQKYWKALPGDVLFYEHFRTYGRLKQSLLRLKSPSWGWKDPRNTFTLPMWLKNYPNAKVIHIIRKGDDVAKSLAKRNTIEGEVQDVRFDQLSFGKDLWQLYVNQAQSYKTSLGNNYLEVSYEDIIDLKTEVINKLEEFTKVSLQTHFEHVVKTPSS